MVVPLRMDVVDPNYEDSPIMPDGQILTDPNQMAEDITDDHPLRTGVCADGV